MNIKDIICTFFKHSLFVFSPDVFLPVPTVDYLHRMNKYTISTDLLFRFVQC